MRASRHLAVAVLAVLGLLCAGCVKQVAGTGTLAADATGAAPTDPATSSGTPSTSAAPTTAASPSTSDTPTPTTDPVKTKEQVTCVLVQATVKNTNDKFNAAKTREGQLATLRTGRANVKSGLDKSGLPRNDRIYLAGVTIYNELTKLIGGAQSGASPSTTPYNNATNRFRTACLSL